MHDKITIDKDTALRHDMMLKMLGTYGPYKMCPSSNEDFEVRFYCQFSLFYFLLNSLSQDLNTIMARVLGTEPEDIELITDGLIKYWEYLAGTRFKIQTESRNSRLDKIKEEAKNIDAIKKKYKKLEHTLESALQVFAYMFKDIHKTGLAQAYTLFTAIFFEEDQIDYMYTLKRALGKREEDCLGPLEGFSNFTNAIRKKIGLKTKDIFPITQAMYAVAREREEYLKARDHFAYVYKARENIEKECPGFLWVAEAAAKYTGGNDPLMFGLEDFEKLMKL